MALSKVKIFNDPVHGHIEMPELCVKIIDTPQFQRLRNIKQLGGCYFVYPGAAHNRFEHSIGTAHLAGCLVESLQTRQGELKITPKDVLCVKIAGLCHDLGHGPFSHLFDGSFIPRTVSELERKWKHEQASLEMFGVIYASLQKDFDAHLSAKDATFIKELINGPIDKQSSEDWPYEGRDKKKGYLYEIISNKESGTDVDKWDYFARDCLHLGMKSSFDHMRCIKMARAIEVNGKWHICYRDKEVSDIYEMFHVRANLHRRAYQHKTSNAIEKMITEALVKADPYLKFEGKDGKMLKMSEAIDDMVAYTKLTDQVYYQILHSSDPQLKEAREILERIERRELYKFIGEHTTEKNVSCGDNEKEEILRLAKSEVDIQVQKKDIILDQVKFDYGKKKEDPVESVYFYRKNEPDTAFKFEKEEVSYMLPKVFLEWKIRLYLCKKMEGADTIKKTHQSLKKGFDEWFKKQVQGQVQDQDTDDGGAANEAVREGVTPEKRSGAESRDGAKAQRRLDLEMPIKRQKK